MICLIQRVIESNVSIDKKTVASINQGLMVLVGFEKADSNESTDRMLEKILHYRVFADEDDKMNRSLIDISGGLLLVPQFTLVANTKKGRRPSFASAAPPQKAEVLFDYLVTSASNKFDQVGAGVFGADMQVSLINNGPVTFWLQV